MRPDKELDDFLRDYNAGVFDKPSDDAETSIKPKLSLYDEQFNFCRSLGLARHKAGLTQTQLAEKIGTTQSVIARLERGRGNPNLHLILKICRQLHVTIQAI